MYFKVYEDPNPLQVFKVPVLIGWIYKHILCKNMYLYRKSRHSLFYRGLSSEQQGAFRESYGMLGQLRAYTKAPMVCLSATAPDDVIQSVSTSLNLVTPNIIRVDVNKENIT